MIAVLDYGIGNLRSAEKALQHLGASATLVTDPEVAAAAEAVVLPGVGNFGRCMEALRQSGLDGVARLAATDGRPFLGICVGMQMLYQGSEESPGVEGLGILPGLVRRLPAGVKHPQMQWNRLDYTAPAPTPARAAPAVESPGTDSERSVTGPGALLEGLDVGGDAWVYFVHSFACPAGAEVVATCDYGGPVTAAVARGALWATQFHPEKSSISGLAVLANFVRAAERAAVERTAVDPGS